MEKEADAAPATIYESAYHESPGDGSPKTIGKEAEDSHRYSGDISHEERRSGGEISHQIDTKEGDPEKHVTGSGAGKTGSGANLRTGRRAAAMF